MNERAWPPKPSRPVWMAQGGGRLVVLHRWGPSGRTPCGRDMWFRDGEDRYRGFRGHLMEVRHFNPATTRPCRRSFDVTPPVGLPT